MNDSTKSPDSQTKPNNPIQPDPETIHTPDPEKKMEGPVSTSIRKAGKFFNGKETKEEADKKRDEHM